MKRILFSYLLPLASSLCLAQNPFVQTWFTSDPAPMVHNGTMYVYTGHDEDNADFFWMQEWRVYSTKDMVNWQDHGLLVYLCSLKAVEWYGYWCCCQ